MKFWRALPFFALFLSAAGLSTGRAQDPEPPPAGAWLDPDLPIPDSPRVVRGRLENGVTYAILPHTTPERVLSLRLLVRAGSLHENDNERGYAHFVEHMAFNGTKHFAAGELVRFLQRQGAQSGPHFNAITSHTRTVYKLDLPANAPGVLESGLRIFRDFSDGILFQRGEVKRERGVILSEARVRRTPADVEASAFTNHVYAGTRIPARMPIGDLQQIARADAAGLRRFYDAWYRPDRLSIVVVGDVSAADAAALIQAHFGSLASRGAPRPEPEIGAIAKAAGPAVAVHARSLAGADLWLISAVARIQEPETWSRRFKGLQVRVALGMIRDRLLTLARQPDAIINDANTRLDVDYLHFRRIDVGVSASPQAIPEALTLLEQELRRALEHGFEPDELAHQQAIVRREVESVVAGLTTVSPSALADSFVDLIEDGSSLALADETPELMLQAIERLTTDGCQAVLRETVGPEPAFVFVSCSAPHAPKVDAVRGLYQASRDRAPEERLRAREVRFAYEDFGPPGAVVEDTHIADLDLHQLRLANDVRVNLKRTGFDAGHVQLLLRVGYGRVAEPADEPGLGLWFPFLWNGGTGRHTADELLRMTDGLAALGMRTDDDAFVITARVPVRQLARALRQLTALVADPAYRKEGWGPTRSALLGQFQPMWSRPEGVVWQFLWPRFAGGDKRLGVPNDATYLARTPEQFCAWLRPQLETGPIEFSLVGDFDSEGVRRELASTLGTLPAREARAPERFRTQLDFLNDRRAMRWYFIGAGDRPSRLEFFWHVSDDITVRDRRLLGLLARVLEARVTEEVREKKSDAYHVGAGITWSDVYPGFCFLTCSVDLHPKKVEKQGRAIRKMALALAEKGIEADELARAKAQALAALTQKQAENQYWLEQVLADSQQRPFRLEAARTLESDVASATVAELNVLAARYLGPGRVFNYLIEPDARKPKQG